MKSFNLLFVVISLIILVSCGFSIGDERTFESEDKEHMARLMKLLDQRRIPYEYTDGMIRYKSSVKEEFEKADRAFDSITPVQFVDSDVRTYFHNILDTEYIEYLELDRDAGTWTAWWPESEERKVKILDQVVEYKIALREEEVSDCDNEFSEAPDNQLFNLDALTKRAL
jgi:hypothetical protein